MLEETADVRGGSRNLHLKAENKGTSRSGAWARAALSFGAPYRNLGGTGAFGVWIKGDGSRALLNLQVGTPREFMHAFSDHYVSLDFTGWRYVELLVRERDVERMNDFVWPYGGAYEMYRNPLDMTHVSQVTLYINDIPACGLADVTVSPVMALPVQSAVLRKPVLTLNGRSLALPFTLASGDFIELEPDGVCTHYSDQGFPLARIRPDTLPVLLVGRNAVHFDCERPLGVSARAEVTLHAFGAPFGTPNPSGEIGWRHLKREYEETRLFLALNDVDNVTWDVMVRRDANATLEVEFCGTMTSPALTVNGRTLHFPVALKDGQRLFCRDGQSWTVIDGHRETVAKGRLDRKIPALISGPNRLSFICTAPDRAQVKLVKVYE